MTIDAGINYTLMKIFTVGVGAVLYIETSHFLGRGKCFSWHLEIEPKKVLVQYGC